MLEVETCTEAAGGTRETEMTAGGGVAITIAAEADFVPSAMEVAEITTDAGFGAAAGAVKVTERGVILERAPQELPEQPPPERFQRTPLF